MNTTESELTLLLYEHTHASRHMRAYDGRLPWYRYFIVEIVFVRKNMNEYVNAQFIITHERVNRGRSSRSSEAREGPG